MALYVAQGYKVPGRIAAQAPMKGASYVGADGLSAYYGADVRERTGIIHLFVQFSQNEILRANLCN
jgi:hypothetical protein